MRRRSRLRFGEGLEFGVAGASGAAFLAGTPVERLAAAAGSRWAAAGCLDAGWIAIGVGATVVVLVGAAALVADHISDNERRGPDGS